MVIGINSIINRSLPDGCFAAGSPCKVIKENVYPKTLSKEDIKKLVVGIIDDWKKLIEFKGVTRTINVNYENEKIFLNQSYHETIYDVQEKTMSGYINDVAEDLRDYLRRRGIKIYTGGLFKSI